MSYHYQYNRTLLSHSKINRKSQTKAEQTLWFYLRKRSLNNHKFRRQHPILNYILDFYCVEKKLAVELDGSQHLKKTKYDNKRAQRLNGLGIKVLRFWDNEVLVNTDLVLEEIVRNLEDR